MTFRADNSFRPTPGESGGHSGLARVYGRVYRLPDSPKAWKAVLAFSLYIRPQSLAGRQGFEPRFYGSEPHVLPLDDLPVREGERVV